MSLFQEPDPNERKTMSPPTIEIDKEKCIECGLCAKDCVSGVIAAENNTPRVAHPEWCNRCSHCLCVCPVQAISHSGLKAAGSRPLQRERLSPESYKEAVLARRSVRWYKPEPLGKETIEEVLEVASYSPTASNALDVSYTVITDPRLIGQAGESVFRVGEKLKKLVDSPWLKPFLAKKEKGGKPGTLQRYMDRFDIYKELYEGGRDVICYNAPALILIHGPKKGRFARDNCAIAATNISNYAASMGLGTCYIGLLVVVMDWSRGLRRKLGAPEDRKTYLALTLGRPSYKYANTPVRPPPNVRWVG